MSIGQVLLAVAVIWLIFDVAPAWSARLLPRWSLFGLCAAAFISSFLPTLGGIPIFPLAVLTAAVAVWAARRKAHGEIWRFVEALLFSAAVLFLARLYLQDELVYSFVQPQWVYGLLSGIIAGVAAQHVRAVTFGAPVGIVLGEAGYWLYTMMTGTLTPVWSMRWLDALVIAALAGMASARLFGWTNWAIYRQWRKKHQALPKTAQGAGPF